MRKRSSASNRNRLLFARFAIFICVLASGLGGVPAGAQDTSTAAAESASAMSDLADTSWQLVKIMSMDDSVYTPDDPTLYTLEFAVDGSVRVRADCNRGTGSWTSESLGQLQFGPIASTRAMCPPGSLHDRYLSQFEWVRSYVIENGNLFLATMADGSIIEFEPVSAAPLAAIVLGEEVRTADADEMQEVIITRLFQQYVAERGIEALDSEIDTYVEKLRRVEEKHRMDWEARLVDLDRQLKSGSLPTSERESLQVERTKLAEILGRLEKEENWTTEEAAEIETMRRDMVRSMIMQWKLNRELYREYGGRIIFQQLGPEPLDAYRQFFEKRQREGAFTIHKPEFEPAFWRYFTDESIHSFYEMGSEAEAQAFAIPPWEQLGTD